MSSPKDPQQVRIRAVETTDVAQLVRLSRLALRRVVAGGRLWSYGEVAHLMTPETYAARVVRGELRDRVLASQLKAGFSVRGILPGYLHDWRSRHFATLLEWQNPDYAGHHATVSAELPRDADTTARGTPEASSS